MWQARLRMMCSCDLAVIVRLGTTASLREGKTFFMHDPKGKASVISVLSVSLR